MSIETRTTDAINPLAAGTGAGTSASSTGAGESVPHELLELLQQALETGMAAVSVHETALRCVTNEDLKTELSEYLVQAQKHIRIVEDLMACLGLDSLALERGRSVVRHKGEALVEAMDLAAAMGATPASQLAAIECVVDAETKDRLNWDLLCALLPRLEGNVQVAVEAACDSVGNQAAEHLARSTGWARELWREHLGLPSTVPPRESRPAVRRAPSSPGPS